MLRSFSLFLSGLLSISFLSLSSAAPNLLVTSGQKIAFMGDSITAAGWEPRGYIHLVVDGLKQEGVDVTPIPAGVGGNTSKDMLARVDQDVFSKHPDWMTLSCGVNDVWHGDQGVDLETYKKNITSIVDQALAKNIKVMILTSTPIMEQDNDNNKKLAAYNDFLRQLAKEKNLPLADLNADFQALLSKHPLKDYERRFTKDGVHMNSMGDVVMAEGILRAFGVPNADIAKIDQSWTNLPDGAFLPTSVNNATISITLQQYRDLDKIAIARGVDVPYVVNQLWVQSVNEIFTEHPHGDLPVFVFQGDCEKRFKDKVLALLKQPDGQ